MSGSRSGRRTLINRGAVSVGSAAVQLAEAEIGSLEGKHILVVGSGEMGLLVAQALAAKHLTAMYVANRTYGRAVILAEKIGGKAVKFCGTLPLHHPLGRGDLLHLRPAPGHPQNGTCPGHEGPVLAGGGTPPPAHPHRYRPAPGRGGGAGTIDGVRLFTIDNLRTINEQTMSTRKAEADRAHGFVEAELAIFLRHLNRQSADEVLAALHTWAETVRVRERDRALARLGAPDEKTAEIVDDLTRVLTKKLLTDATFSIRTSAEEGDLAAAEALVRAITRGDRIEGNPPKE